MTGAAELTMTGEEEEDEVGGRVGGLKVGGGVTVGGLMVPCGLGGYVGSVDCSGLGFVGGGWVDEGGFGP